MQNTPKVNALFSHTWSAQGMDLPTALRMAWEEDNTKTLKVIFSFGAVREGNTDRRLFMGSLLWLWKAHPKAVLQNLGTIPEVASLKAVLDLLMYVTHCDDESSLYSFATQTKRADDRTAHKNSLRTEEGKQQWYAERMARKAALRMAFARSMGKPLGDLCTAHPVSATTERCAWVSSEVALRYRSFCSARDTAAKVDAQYERHQRRFVERQIAAQKQNDVNVAKLYAAVSDLFAEGICTDYHMRENAAGLHAKWAPTYDGMHDKATGIARLIAMKVLPRLDMPCDRWDQRYQRDVLAIIRRRTELAESYVGKGEWASMGQTVRMAALCRDLYGKGFKERAPKAYAAAAAAAAPIAPQIAPSAMLERVEELYEKSTDEQSVADISAQWQAMENSALGCTRHKGLACLIPVCGVTNFEPNEKYGDASKTAVSLAMLLAKTNHAGHPFDRTIISWKGVLVPQTSGDVLQNTHAMKEQCAGCDNADYIRVFRAFLKYAVAGSFTEYEVEQAGLCFIYACPGEDEWDYVVSEVEGEYAAAGYRMPKVFMWSLGYELPNIDGRRVYLASGTSLVAAKGLLSADFSTGRSRYLWWRGQQWRLVRTYFLLCRDVCRKILALPGHIWEGVVELPSLVYGTAVDIAKALQTLVKDIFTGVARIPGHLWDAAVDVSKAMQTLIRDVFTALIDMGKAVARIPGHMWDAAVEGAKAMQTLGSDLYAAVARIPGHMWHIVIEISKTMPSIQDVLSVPLDMGKAVARIPGRVWNIVVDIAKALQTLVGDVFTAVARIPGRMWGVAVGVSKAMQTLIKDVFTALIDMGKAVARIPGHMWDAAVDVSKATQTLIKDIFTAVARIPGRVWDGTVSIAKAMQTLVKDVFTVLIDMGKAVARIPGQVWNIVVDIAKATQTLVGDMFAAVARIPGHLWDAAVDVSKAMQTLIRDVFTALIDMGKAVARIPGRVWNVAVDIAKAVQTLVGDVFTAVARIPGRMWGVAVDVSKAMQTLIRDVFTALIDMGKAVARIPGHMWDAAVDVSKAMQTLIKDIFTAVARIPGRVWDGTVSIAKAVQTLVKDVFTVLIDMGKAVARIPGQVWNIVVDIAKSVQTLVGDVFTAVARIPGRMWGAAVDVSKAMQTLIKDVFIALIDMGKAVARIPGHMWDAAVDVSKAMQALIKDIFTAMTDAGGAVLRLPGRAWQGAVSLADLTTEVLVQAYGGVVQFPWLERTHSLATRVAALPFDTVNGVRSWAGSGWGKAASSYDAFVVWWNVPSVSPTDQSFLMNHNVGERCHLYNDLSVPAVECP